MVVMCLVTVCGGVGESVSMCAFACRLNGGGVDGHVLVVYYGMDSVSL